LRSTILEPPSSGGEVHNNAYAALVSSTGVITPLTGAIPIGIGQINSVAIILPFLSNIPTGSLTGNNLIFANYINEFAPEDAFYFVPAVLDGTLNAALQRAAPTQNAFSFYTASYNLFYLSTSFETHFRNQHSSRIRISREKTVQTSASSNTNDYESEDQLLGL
jgi:hypothetical protein